MPKAVLIIEDDTDARAVYSTALRDHGYEVLEAVHGAEGVHQARTRQPDLILMDIRMPVMSGWDAIRYLRAYDETKLIPIVGISAYAPKEEQVERIGSLGFDAFLIKPIEPNDVIRTIRECIGPPEDGPPAVAETVVK